MNKGERGGQKRFRASPARDSNPEWRKKIKERRGQQKSKDFSVPPGTRTLNQAETIKRTKRSGRNGLQVAKMTKNNGWMMEKSKMDKGERGGQKRSRAVPPGTRTLNGGRK